MTINLTNLDEDDINVLEFCVNSTLESWKKSYNEDILKKPKSGLEIECLGYTKDWIDIMEKLSSILAKEQEKIDEYYAGDIRNDMGNEPKT